MGQHASSQLFFGVVIDRQDYDYEDEESWPFDKELDKELAHALGVVQPAEEWTEANSETVYSVYWEKCREMCKAHPVEISSVGYSEESDIVLMISTSRIRGDDYGSTLLDLQALLKQQKSVWPALVKETARLLNLTIDESKIGWTMSSSFG